MAKIVKNQIASDLSIDDIGITLSSLETRTIPPGDYYIWAASIDAVTAINAGNIKINDGYDDLDKTLAIKHIQEESVPRSSSYIATALVQATSASTYTLVAASRLLHIFTGTVAGQILQMPNATTLTIGHRYEVWNTSTQSVNIKNDAGTSLFIMSAQQKTWIVLQDNTTSNGTWLFESNFLGGTGGGGNGPIVFGFDGNGSTGRWLELATNVPTDLTKAIVAGSKIMRAISFGTSGDSTCTVTVYKNGVVLDTISTSATSKNSKINLTHVLVDQDELSARITSGSGSRPVVFTWL